MKYLLYNPYSKSGQGSIIRNQVLETLGINSVLRNVVEMKDKVGFLESLMPTDEVIILGGDGTLNVFCNSIRGYTPKNKIYIYRGGSGNEFIVDVAPEEKMVQINNYIKNLPTVDVAGKEMLFVNNVGFGLDGACCTLATKCLANKPYKEIKYANLAVRLILFSYKKCDATVKVDDEEYHFKHVWLAPGMNGRYYGDGMEITPNQDRRSDKLSVCIIHDACKLKALMIFSKIFNGRHLHYKKNVSILTGKTITVTFSSPRDCQVDGEVFQNVTTYTIKK